MNPGPPKVLYLVGKGRSGSTLLANLLGALPGVFATGELARLWDWGLIHGFRCGCGTPIDECPVWRDALRGAFGDAPPAPGDIVGLRDRVLRWGAVPRLLLRPRPWPALDSWTSLATDLYRGIAGATGARVLVDAQKWPADPGPLGLMEGIDPYVVHLVRDPRGVAHSWQRQKSYEDRGPDARMPRFGPVHSALSWTGRNAVAELVRRRGGTPWAIVRYEDLVAEPRTVLRRVLDLLEEPADHLPVDEEGRALLPEHHMVGGNPSRERGGHIRLSADQSWEAELPARQELVTTALTLPLLRRYGYPLRPRTS